jgi:hypothetical protein
MNPRPFCLADSMILVVAAAVGMAFNRVDWDISVPMANQNLYEAIRCFVELTTPYLAALTVASLAMLLRRPRPPLRRLFRSPGAVACTVATAALVLVACWAASATAASRAIMFSQNVRLLPNRGGTGRGGAISDPLTGRLLVVYGDQVGFAVAGAWLSLMLAGRWRPERTWIDRLGRAVGWCWLGLAIVLWAHSLLL